MSDYNEDEVAALFSNEPKKKKELGSKGSAPRAAAPSPNEYMLWITAIPEEQRLAVAEVIDEMIVENAVDVARVSLKLMKFVALGRLPPQIAQQLQNFLRLAFESVTFEATLLNKNQNKTSILFANMINQAKSPPQIEQTLQLEDVEADMAAQIKLAASESYILEEK